jgi:hypothetical protein
LTRHLPLLARFCAVPEMDTPMGGGRRLGTHRNTARLRYKSSQAFNSPPFRSREGEWGCDAWPLEQVSGQRLGDWFLKFPVGAGFEAGHGQKMVSCGTLRTLNCTTW